MSTYCRGRTFNAEGTVLLTLKTPLSPSVCVCSKLLTAQMDRMELQKVNIELDEESNSGDSTEDNYTEMVDPEKATISR